MTPRILNYILWDQVTPLISIDFTTAPSPRLIKKVKYKDDGFIESIEYLGKNERELCVLVTFDQDVEKKLVKSTTQWLNDDDSVYAEVKEDINYTNIEFKQVQVEQRQNLVNKLKVRSEKWEKEGYLDDILDFFSNQVFTFIQTGSRVVVKAINDTLEIVVADLPQEERTRVRKIQNILNDTFEDKTIAEIVKSIFRIQDNQNRLRSKN